MLRAFAYANVGRVKSYLDFLKIMLKNVRTFVNMTGLELKYSLLINLD